MTVSAQTTLPFLTNLEKMPNLKPDLTKFKAVLFDMDGVLVDATEWHYESLNSALSLFGHCINRKEHETTFNGLPTREKLKMLSESRGLPLNLHKILNEKKQLNLQEFIFAKCRPDYEKQIMLKYLKRQGLKLACCSNAIKDSIETMLKRSQIFPYFEEILGNDEGIKNKPEPDIYLEAMKRLEVKPDECLIVEDAPHGIAAARASGATVLEVQNYKQVNLSLYI